VTPHQRRCPRVSGWRRAGRLETPVPSSRRDAWSATRTASITCSPHGAPDSTGATSGLYSMRCRSGCRAADSKDGVAPQQRQARLRRVRRERRGAARGRVAAPRPPALRPIPSRSAGSIHRHQGGQL
jgi:hypothetical protein